MLGRWAGLVTAAVVVVASRLSFCSSALNRLCSPGASVDVKGAPVCICKIVYE